MKQVTIEEIKEASRIVRARKGFICMKEAKKTDSTLLSGEGLDQGSGTYNSKDCRQ